MFRRVAVQLDFEMDGAAADLIDLSIDGFAISGAPPRPAGSVIPVVFGLSVDGVEIGTALQARMVYNSPLRAAGRFIEPTPSQTALLRYLVTWRGKSAGALGATGLLDAIAGIPPRNLSPGDSPVLELPGRRPPWWSRLLARLPFFGGRTRDRDYQDQR